MKVRRALVESLDLTSATARTLQDQAPLLPRHPGTDAIEERTDELAQWIAGQITGEFTPSKEEIVAVSKGSHGIRPVAVWGLTERIFYSALVERLVSSGLEPVARTGTGWREFKEKPASEDCRYVVTADLAACYSLIDHGLLAYELRLQTGDYEAVDVVTDLLRETSDRSYGLPQQSTDSDILADAFEGVLERALHRRGLRAIRYNDDFRLMADSWSEVVRSIEILDEEARKLGLILNDSKTRTWRKDRYVASLKSARELKEKIAEESEVNLTQVMEGPYDTWILSPDPDDIEVLTSVRLLERWQEVAGSGEVLEDQRAEHIAILELLPGAFEVLEPEPEMIQSTLQIALQMLKYEQRLTPHICRFLVSHTDVDPVLTAVDDFLGPDPYLTGWQTWWLQTAVGSFDEFREGTRGDRLIDWVQNSVQRFGHNDLLAAHFLHTLARHGATTQDELLARYDRSSSVARHPLVIGMGHIGINEPLTTAIAKDSLPHRWLLGLPDE